MADVDDGLSLNISFAAVKKKKKSRGKFFGKKNYRNPNREKFLGTTTRQVLNTSSVQKKSFQPAGNVESARDGTNQSTALHFKGVASVAVIEQFKKKNHVIRKQKHAGNITTQDKSSRPSTDTQPVTKAHVGPWKSSLFNQNPEIPKINQVDVSKISEEVFTEKKFSSLPLHPHLVSCVTEKLGLKNMTFIQQASIPVLLSKKDAFVKSQTGSGKTLAYALPIVHMLQEAKPEITRSTGPVALVLTPTRELALQSYEVFTSLTKPFCRIVPSWIIGGENRKSEKSRIRKGVNIVVGTPGRVLDHMQTTKNFTFANLRYLVFDEADRLLDMGFQTQIESVLKELKTQCQQKYQTVLLSATLSDKVECLASLTLDNPTKVHVTNSTSHDDEDEETTFAQPDNLKQHVAIVPSKLRLVSLTTFLKAKLSRNIKTKMIVFLSCRDSVEFHHQLFRRILRHPGLEFDLAVQENLEMDGIELEEVDISELHGGMSQTERQDVFRKFSSAESGVLLTTDVAARGLDLPSVAWVVQYTSPGSPVEYIHRVGRTARAGKTGNALLMLTPAEVKYVKLLTQFSIKVTEMSVDDILTLSKSVSKKAKSHPGLWQRTVEQAKSEATSLQNQIEHLIEKSIKTKTLARTAYMSFIRAYASYSSALKSIFHVKHLHLGHVAKGFGLRDAPKDIVKTLEKSVSHLPVRTSFEYRQAKIDSRVAADKATEAEENGETDTNKLVDDTNNNTEVRPRLSRKQAIKRKMHRKPDLMSEFSSGMERPKKARKA